LKIRPNACRHLKILCILGLRLKFALRTKSDLFYQVTLSSHVIKRTCVLAVAVN